MDDTINLPLLDRYFSGTCSSAERSRVEAWAAADASHRAQLQAYRAICEGWTAARVTGGDARAAWTRLAAEVGRDATGAPVTIPATRTLRLMPAGARWHAHWRSSGAIAAVVVIALVIGFAAGTVRQHASGSGHQYVTTAGQRETVTLRDGSQIALAPASRLTVPADFGRGARRVELEGEAYFAVVHDATLPFRVHAGSATATDVGTQFDIRAYAADDAVRIAIAEGEVCVMTRKNRLPAARAGAARSESCRPADDPASSSRPLRVGDVATITDTTILVTPSSDVAALTAWRNGRLVFRRTSLAEALPELSRWYGVTITAPTLETRQITATVDQPTVTAALDMLAPAVGAHYTLHGDRAVLTPLPGHP